METQGIRAALRAQYHWFVEIYRKLEAFIRRYERFQSPLAKIIYHGAWVGFSLFVVIHAWVSEDAYITLRVLDNFFNGYGLRWNINERVQVYTHPLWMLLHIPVNAIISNLFLTNVLLSWGCTTAALLVTLKTERKPLFFTLCCLYLPLFASKAFRDYSTSGLENPLSYLLFASFGYIVLNKFSHPRFWFYCSLSVTLALFTRLDLAIFYAPALMWLVWARGADIRWKQVVLGALPLALWFCFSLFYYGFLFPNTKYAKLDTGVELFRYIHHGFTYAWYTIVTDTATAIEIISSVVFLVIAFLKNPPSMHPVAMFAASIAMGQCWYVVYLLMVGGDYMVGRFWAYPVFIGVWLVYIFVPADIHRWAIWGMVAVLLVTGAPLPTSWMLRKHYCMQCFWDPTPMIDARVMFYGNRFVRKLYPPSFNTEAHHKFVGWASPLAKKAPHHVEKAHYIGMLGYYAGPGNILIDELALGDPLLARLPVTHDEEGFLIGHFRRTLPVGYIEAVKTGSTDEMDPSLALYYEKLRLITSGDLMDPERLETIFKFNLGSYDQWKQAYLTCNIW